MNTIQAPWFAWVETEKRERSGLSIYVSAFYSFSTAYFALYFFYFLRRAYKYVAPVHIAQDNNSRARNL
jgi:hypothetical protein